VEENMFYLKELSDARAIRNRITQNIEVATLGGVSAAERRRLLSFVIVGGGPTGVEFSAELHDFVVEVRMLSIPAPTGEQCFMLIARLQDLLKMYPEVYPEVTITIIEGRQLLGAFDASLRCAS
jgi:NADH dehydrogenase FAD-containing subunit